MLVTPLPNNSCGADIAKNQETGSGEGVANVAAENSTVEPKPAAAEKTESVKSVFSVPANAPFQEEAKVTDTATLPIAVLPAAVQETNPEQTATNPDNSQPEQVHVEEIKSSANPVNVEVVPEQVLIQETLTATSVDSDVTEQKKEVTTEAKPEAVVVEQKKEAELAQSQPEQNEEVKTVPQPEVVAPEQSKEEVKVEAQSVAPEASADASPSSENGKAEAPEVKESGDWLQREQELLKKIEQLETVKTERSEDGLKLELKIREEEVDLLKARVKNLETELQAALSKPGGKNQEMIEKIKLQHEELLSKARGMIFDKTKVVKNQELQIDALNTQIQSLKDINVITKDLLEIRNSEVKAMEERLQVMEARFKGEKERYDLVLKRAQTSTNINDDLRKEYETQLSIFKELREKYELRVQALVAENNRLKESLQRGATS
ncbi:uncharacterized protein LOC112046984 isoform X2 [Bicyclus anynana]|uniref:Uncharacterized protein LOC112046984 isoform X2 n=1 Tax=Bicyclus anynana TaxID=110368 RepID=A0ABM3LKV8_BICAN|nr:uncharacterized protein LOC112046984 isoform X2 [Bicyclus anynana]